MAQAESRREADASETQSPKTSPESQSNSSKADIDVPERPALAPDIELSGDMQDSAFEEQQWLVQRDGRFIQVTELLYRIAENINGERTLEDVAEQVSAATGRGVSADNIRQLVASKLIPMGIVLQADGTVAASATAEGPRSPLAVNMRMAVVPGKYIEPIATVLQYLFWPPLIIIVLVVSAVSLGWLFFVHGVAGTIHQALYSPGLLLVALGIIIVSTIWHEFGHAAALKYGGGKVRGMGAGLYLVYPAFYTDVTDNYRLGRWARVRTDLGGFYFNLMFAVGLIGLYLVTGAEFLLLVVLFICLDIVHQILPFVRLDGYWALADMTGIPDFFSHVGPFLRSVLPIPGWKGRKMPNVKGWVKFVFGAYILITIPLLIFVLLFMITGLPRILATAWDSLGIQFNEFTASQSAGDIVGMAAAAVQAVLLAIPAFGMLYILYKLGQRILVGLWRWSTPTPLRRAIGSTATAGAAALIAIFWLPSLPLPGGDPNPIYAETRFSPIRTEERGTVADVTRGVPVLSRVPVIGGGPRQGTIGPAASPTTEPEETPAAPAVEPAQTQTVTSTETVVPAASTEPAETAAPTDEADVTPTVAGSETPEMTPTATGSETPEATPSVDPATTSTPEAEPSVTASPETEVTPSPETGEGGLTPTTTPAP